MAPRLGNGMADFLNFGRSPPLFSAVPLLTPSQHSVEKFDKYSVCVLPRSDLSLVYSPLMEAILPPYTFVILALALRILNQVCWPFPRPPPQNACPT